MTKPLFPRPDDPGSSFIDLLRVNNLEPPVPDSDVSETFTLAHGTTVLAIRYADGALVAGDRRATSGHIISHRSIEKVFAADKYSGIAIAGAAGPAVEMVKLFQLQLEHYEKVEGHVLSLEGKANQLSQMIRNNLPAAMQGLAVVPIFAGFDRYDDQGRLFQFDVTGGRYEERDYATSGSGSLHAGTVIKINFANGMSRDAVINLAIEALFQAADDDSASGLPDLIRGIYPVVATITSDGFERVADDELAERTDSLIDQLRSAAGADQGNALAKGGDAR
ncbi:MAG: proteasome subunit beta [Acidimicrobiales bacterium]|nr:proteasome subunit beta [Acidimicrobiales bacterium]